MRDVSTIGYFAYEAGAAAAMAPVWRRSGRNHRIGLSGPAARRLSVRPDVDLEDRTGPDALCLDGLDLLFLSATGREVEGALITLAAFRAIPVIQVIDTWGPYRDRFTHGMAPRITVPDQVAVLEAVEDGLPRERLTVTGNPAWDGPHRLSEGEPRILAFLAQPVRRLYGGRLGYDERAALDVVRDFRASRPDLVKCVIVVPHPAGDDTDGSEPRISLAEAVKRAEMVVGIFSSAMVDAALAGRRVASVQPGLPAHDMCPLSRQGLIDRVGESAALARALSQAPRAATALAASMAGSTDRFLCLIDETIAACASLA